MDIATLLSKKPTASLIGFGRSNAALARFLTEKGLPLTLRDARPLAALGADAAELAALGVRFLTGDGYLDALTEELLFLAPAVRPDLAPILAARARGACITSEMALFAALTPARLLGVTGSDGKTTTTTLAGLLLDGENGTRRCFVGGNIGQPLIARLAEMKVGDLAIAELSSFQLMTPMQAPARAVITNLTENHLNWHTDMAEYEAAKWRIMGKGTEAVLYADDPRLIRHAHSYPCPTLFSLARTHGELRQNFPNCHTITVYKGDICIDGAAVGRVSDILLPGRHNLLNYMAALGLVHPYLADVPAAFLRVARSFRGVPHRLEFAGEIGGVRYFNSSIDSTPSRTAASVAALGGSPIVLCGGADKGVSFAPLCEALAGRAKAVVLFGAARGMIAEALSKSQLKIEIRVTMREALAAASRMAERGDSVLLSPACTSFDEFRDYEERGECFRRWIYEDNGG